MPKGWDRLSIATRSRPIKVERDITRQDLLIPNSSSTLALLGGCLACGAMISVLWGWFGLTFVTLFFGLGDGPWFWWAMLAIGAGSALGLFAYASWERAHDREWLERY
jgi:hypothetical protein